MHRITTQRQKHILPEEAPLSTLATLAYDPHNSRTKRRKHFLIARVDRSVVKYYQWWIWQRFRVKLTDSAWKPHCTVVRGERPRTNAWRAHKGEKITLQYSPAFWTNGKHWWLPVYSVDIQNIRRELGLRPLPYAALHITVGSQVY